MDDYIPPASPEIVFKFDSVAYVAPVSPEIIFVFGGAAGPSGPDPRLAGNFMLLLTF